MPKVKTIREEPELNEFEEYKAEEFKRLGLSASHSNELAGRADITIRDIERLIEKGCRPHLAYRILRPL